MLLTGEGSDELFGGYRWLQTTYDDWSRAELVATILLADRTVK